MIMKNSILSLSLAVLISAAGMGTATAKNVPNESFFQETNSAAYSVSDQLAKRFNTDKPLLVMTAQNLNNLGESEKIGRLVGELVSSSLTRQGWRVQEVRMREDVRISSEGEHMLSRDLDKVKYSYDADIAIVSTYTQVGNQLYVTLKAVRIADGLVVAGQSFVTRIPGRV